MANFNGVQMAKILASPPKKPDVTYVGGRLRVFNEQVVFNGQAIGDTITVGRIPKGAIPLFFIINTDTSTGTATLAIGDGTTANRFAAAATRTTVNAPQMRGDQAPGATELTDETDIVLTVGSAALPASGNLSLQTVYTLD